MYLRDPKSHMSHVDLDEDIVLLSYLSILHRHTLSEERKEKQVLLLNKNKLTTSKIKLNSLVSAAAFLHLLD